MDPHKLVQLEDYEQFVGPRTIERIKKKARSLRHLHVAHVNSTYSGGGVAQLLTSLTLLMNSSGIKTGWRIIHGPPDFFSITKKMHNALHGVDIRLDRDELDYFIEVNRQNAKEIREEAEIVFIHDPQPVALVEQKERSAKKWVWRCHIDFTNPKAETWDFLRRYVETYDCAVFSAPAFSRTLGIRQVLISPSIDPLSNKNKDLSDELIDSVCGRFGIDRQRPIITQISRFDYLKDPVGVIRTYRMVKEHLDCQLVLAGGGATDDPEGMKVLEDVHREAGEDPDIFVVFLPPGSDVEINALQRGSDVILQKSLKEGFGLTVAEALWKGKPVIASAVGGIPLQIAHKYSGILTHSIEGTAYWIKQLINEPDYAKKLGANGKEHIRSNFLITRHIRDYLLLFLSLYDQRDIISL
jgi:trehalose synthase